MSKVKDQKMVVDNNHIVYNPRTGKPYKTIDEVPQKERNLRDIAYLEYIVREHIKNDTLVSEEDVDRLTNLYKEENLEDRIMTLNLNVNDIKLKVIQNEIEILESIYDRTEEEELKLKELKKESTKCAREILKLKEEEKPMSDE